MIFTILHLDFGDDFCFFFLPLFHRSWFLVTKSNVSAKWYLELSESAVKLRFDSSHAYYNLRKYELNPTGLEEVTSTKPPETKNGNGLIRDLVTKNQKWAPKSGIPPTSSSCNSELRWSLTTNQVIFNTRMIVAKRLAQEWSCLECLGRSKTLGYHFLAKCPRTL